MYMNVNLQFSVYMYVYIYMHTFYTHCMPDIIYYIRYHTQHSLIM